MNVRVLQGDCREVLRTLPDASVQCCVTSPPYYGLRDYGVAGQIGLEHSPAEYVAQMVEVFREVHRVLRDDGTVWLNLGDSYAGSGKGGNPEAGKQATNKGSQTIGVLYGTGQTARDAAVTNVTRDVSGFAPKQLLGIPWRVAIALQDDGWWLRSDIVWHKPNPMPESVTDRPTSSHEHVFLLAKSGRYFYDADAVREPMTASSISRLQQDVESQTGSMRANGGAKSNGPMKAVAKGNARTFRGGGAYTGGRNLRNVWTIATQPFSEAHFATFPPELAERCIRAGCPAGGTVLDPFGGAGTTALVADRLGRNSILIEINPQYCDMSRNRLTDDAGMFAEVA